MTDRKRVLAVYGTRPEAVKMAPLVRELRKAGDLDVVVAVTGQHREMLDQVNEVFEIVPDHDLNIIKPRQSLTSVTTAALTGLSEVVEYEHPDVVVVQGDTTTALTGALAGFYHGALIAHVEAGLRSGHLKNPFPEEANRRLVGTITDLHLAPTARARADLLREGFDPASIVVTGNTVIDALLWTVRRGLPYTTEGVDAFLTRFPEIVLVTAHRRESWGEPLAEVGSAIAELARRNRGVGFVIPAHLNPAVRESLLPPVLGLDNVLITDPLPYGEFCRLMNDSTVILTDSGGVQEEAPSLGRPVIVTRETTERHEGVEVGVAELVGTDRQRIMTAVTRALADSVEGRNPAPRNPYGDGLASWRATAAIREMLGLGARVADFEGDGRADVLPAPRRIEASVDLRDASEEQARTS